MMRFEYRRVFGNSELENRASNPNLASQIETHLIDKPDHISVNGVVFSTRIMIRALRLCPRPELAYLIDENVEITYYNQRGELLSNVIGTWPSLVMKWRDGASATFKSKGAIDMRKKYYQTVKETAESNKKAAKDRAKAEREKAKVERELRKAEKEKAKAEKEKAKAEKLPKQKPKVEPTRSRYRELRLKLRREGETDG